MNNSRFMWHFLAFAIVGCLLLSSVGEVTESYTFTVGKAFSGLVTIIMIYGVGFCFGYNSGEDDGRSQR